MLSRHRRAFALPELVVTIALAAVVCSLLIVLSPRSRQMAWQAGSIANLHEFATATCSYAADNTDQFWSFTWQANTPLPSQYPDLQLPRPYALDAASAQAVDIMRRRAGATQIPFIPLWVPHINNSHLVLADYLETPLPMRFTVSPGDRHRQLWSNDIEGFRNGDYLPVSPDPGDLENWRWPYSTSYRVPTHFMSPDSITNTIGTLVQIHDHRPTTTSGGDFVSGGRVVSQATFPSLKVHVFDYAQWSGVKAPMYHAYAFARVPMLMVDGAAHVRLTGQANRGFQPNNPRSAFPIQYNYVPDPWEPAPSPGASINVSGYFDWTRGGVRGADYEGPEVDTSNW
jgi:hypothetical protein